MIEARLAEPKDAFLLGPRMRQEDVDEVKACSGLFPAEALLLGVEKSVECYTLWAGDQPLAMYGIVEDQNPSIGCIWLLGSDLIYEHRVAFLRISRPWIERFQSQYPILYNYIDARNTVHIRWLQWLGFSFISEHPEYGVEKRLFYQFIRINTNV